ncbi:MAG: biotin--[acetyl-CoA-carboxylase] ligase [Planctomycetaceae bacterium]|nr:MAG: biotin--[acetyl-CoA-carboxylase] ligase [Planctomycetaceae bacterium]
MTERTLSVDVRETCSHLESSGLVAAVEWFAELDSTNDYALRRGREPALALPRLIWADRQTAGRGRGAHRWWAERGALTFSLIWAPSEHPLPHHWPHRFPQLSLVAALAMAYTLEAYVEPARIRLKWPNDVWLDGRKVCGLLLESLAEIPGRVVIGVGCNVAVSLAQAPADIRQQAIALAEIVHPCPSPATVLTEWCVHWQQLSRAWWAETLALPACWRPWCALHGHHIRVQQGNKVYEGRCLGLDPQGGLRLLIGAHEQIFWAGETQLVRPSAPDAG